MNALVSAHSGLRWLVLLSLLVAILVAFLSRKNNSIEKKQKISYLLALVFSHIQLLIGIVLYFFHSGKVVFSSETMSNPITRFFTVEHLLGMVIAIALITIGYSKAKKQQSNKKIFSFYLIALVIIFASIPWPFREALGVMNWA